MQAFVGVGTVTNIVTIVVGSLIGLALGNRLSARTRDSVTDVLGLVTLVVGGTSLIPLLQPTLKEAVPAGAALIVILLALLLGTILGSALRLEDRLNDLGEWARRKLGGRTHSGFAEGFVTATLIFCIGPLAILGSLSDGLGRGAEQLIVKSVLDGFASIAFASALGVGVMLSVVPVALYQGTMTLIGYLLGDVLPAAQVDAITVTGGLILMGLSLRLLDIKAVRVADMIPALAFAPLMVWGAGLF
ncbi:MAG TPA: DUF554 domain-containing protein [Propionibacteriaceae bacterium]|nr:DUF554 domain-containing protein [Propionibacteriaceae bacterium]